MFRRVICLSLYHMIVLSERPHYLSFAHFGSEDDNLDDSNRQKRSESKLLIFRVLSHISTVRYE